MPCCHAAESACRGREAIWFPWCWAVVNLAVFSTWAVAKPNYYLPCLPGAALLAGMAWIRLSRAARATERPVMAKTALALLGGQWVMILAAGTLAPLLSGHSLGGLLPVALAVVMGSAACAVAASGVLWRRGKDELALLPVLAASAVGVLVGYGMLAPADNPARGHRTLARELERRVPANVGTIHFFHEIDKGLWFYLDRLRLAPVPGSQPRYSESYDRIGGLLSAPLAFDAPADPTLRRADRQMAGLVDWLKLHGPERPYLVLRSALYARMAPDLGGRTTLLYQEDGMKRNTLTLLQIHPLQETGAPTR